MEKANEEPTQEISLEKALTIFWRRLHSQTMFARMSDIEALDRRINETPSESLPIPLHPYENDLKGVWRLIKSNIEEENPGYVEDLVHQGLKKMADLCPDDEEVSHDKLRRQYWNFLSLLRLFGHPAVFDVQISSAARMPVERHGQNKGEVIPHMTIYPNIPYQYYTACYRDGSHEKFGSPVNHTETRVIYGCEFIPKGLPFSQEMFLVRTGNPLIQLSPHVRYVVAAEACNKEDASLFKEKGRSRLFFDRFWTTRVPIAVQDAAIEKFGPDFKGPKVSGLPYE